MAERPETTHSDAVNRLARTMDPEAWTAAAAFNDGCHLGPEDPADGVHRACAAGGRGRLGAPRAGSTWHEQDEAVPMSGAVVAVDVDGVLAHPRRPCGGAAADGA